LLPPKEQTAALQGSGQAGIQVRTANQEESWTRNMMVCSRVARANDGDGGTATTTIELDEEGWRRWLITSEIIVCPRWNSWRRPSTIPQPHINDGCASL
jgi:hypothetical protein